MEEMIEKLEKEGADAIRFECEEIPPDDIGEFAEDGWIAEPKWDGWFVALAVKDRKGVMYSRAKKYREGIDCSGLDDGIYVGELIENTEWSFKFQNGKYHGKLVLFDIISRDGSYLERLQRLREKKRPDWILVVDVLPEISKEVFEKVVSEGFEGLVLVDLNSGKRIKVKKVIEDDFVIMGFIESNSATAKAVGGMVQAIEYGDGKKVIGQCGSMPHWLKIDMYKNPQKYLGRVVTIRGKERFKSGALRHPAFVCFRDDKRR